MLVNPFFWHGLQVWLFCYIFFEEGEFNMWTDQCHSLVGLFCYIILEKVFSLFLSCRCGVRFFFSFLGGWGVAVGWLTFVNFSCSLEEQDSSFWLSEPLHIITWHWPTRILKNIKLPFSKVLYHRFVLAGLVGNTLSVSEIKFNFE